MASKKKRTYDEIRDTLLGLAPHTIGNHVVLGELSGEEALRAEADVFSKMRDEERVLQDYNVRLLKAPKPGHIAFTRMLRLGKRMKRKDIDAITPSPLFEVITHLSLNLDKMLDDDLSAFLDAPSLQSSPLRHLHLHPYGTESHGRILAQSALAQRLESLELTEQTLRGLIASGVALPNLRRLEVLGLSSALYDTLTSWPAFEQIDHLGSLIHPLGSRAPLPPRLSSLRTSAAALLSLLPSLERLEALHLTNLHGEGALDALAARASLGLRSLTCESYLNDELADYLVQCEEDLERLVLLSHPMRRSVVEALQETSIRPRALHVAQLSQEATLHLLDAPLVAEVRELSLGDCGDAVIERLMTHLPHLDRLTVQTSAENLRRLAAASPHTFMGESHAWVIDPFRSSDPPSSLQTMLIELERVSGSKEPYDVLLKTLFRPERLALKTELWWDADMVSHDTYHLGTKASFSKVRSLDGVEKLTALKTLGVRDNDIDSVEQLTGLPLTYVQLEGNTRLRNIAPLATCKAIETLDISRTNVRDLRPLLELPALQTLTLRGLTINDEGAQVLATLAERGVTIRQ